jgi:dephospho-CoA kinase
MKVLGLTGGIGSGKTVVAELLQVLGVPVYDSDNRSKMLCNTDENLKNGLVGLFGPELYVDGKLNRQRMAERIFGDEMALKAVNALIHPAVVRDFVAWGNEHARYPIIVMETAILFEAGLENLFDKVITVTAPEDLRLERVCKRNAQDPESVRARMSSQMPEPERVKKSDFVVVNDDRRAVLPQVIELLKSLSSEDGNT